MVLATHPHPGHLDAAALAGMLAASPQAKLVLPKSAAEQARAAGIDYARMTTTDSGLRVEYFKNGAYSRVYAVPSAHPRLDATPIGGFPYLGYLIRTGGMTIYHAGDCVPYEGLADRLRPYRVTVALLPISGPPANFGVEQASELASEIGARWLVPMHYGTFEGQPTGADHFVSHMLFQRPEQRFKVFQCGEGWAVPED
jgi:L-ascorbate metabolism protein UlaG (beta-lactamase superfamily)